MKTIKDVDQKLEYFIESAELDEKARKKLEDDIPTYRQLYRAAVSMAVSKSGTEAIDAYQVSLKLRTAEPNVSLEDAEFRLLKNTCEANPVGWMAFFHAQAILRLQAAEKGG